ncbi:MAG: DUF4832 domain-containing protein [Bacteroidales bacterium]|nr:DUF4832 domain-containing protein [Bacteroidales bacterium]
MEAVSYEPTDAIIANPERGFYSAQEIFSVSSKGISRDGAAANRKNYRTLYLLEFHLKDFVNSDISEEYLQTIRTYFQSMRDGGAKCILRFCYSNGMNESDKPWDASPAQTLRHVAQIKPILQEYDDIIFVVQAGFIGSWGEWYYTENYDNASRKALLEALLDAVPASRQIELRTPAFKMNLYGYSLADTLTRATAHTTDVKARLAGHNDCYLASANDQGTFSNSNERKFWTAESAYTIMGGETCATSAYCDCQPKETPKAAHGALADLAQYHFTYMNQGYHQGVLNRWKTGGCFEEIQKRLGYRYVLDKGQFTDSPAAGAAFRIVLDLHNEGFSPVQNPRDAEFVLTDKGGKVLETYPLNSDPRYWMAGESVTVDQTLTLPSGISGEVTLWLNLPDPCENLRNNPLYSIRLANKDVWDEETGYNKLHTLTL